jgi:hypothetical protein
MRRSFPIRLMEGRALRAFGPSAVMEFLLSVAEFRPPFLLGSNISFENSLLPAQQPKRMMNSSCIPPVKMNLPVKC